ncbi:hypothetical protein C5K18_12420 [Shigella dysenteriae]|uniref:Nitrite extrusion protein 2 n=1 Tax=Shigella dysenteriae TaxID=622 RepID=A0A2S8DBM8_SHIDY|nr:hypothetical protein C5K18_12420 [Shigella dysenteriae]PQN37405.1 hypothetical protein C5K23_05800 [Shigella boydii]
MTSLKTSIKTITYLSDTGCLEIQGASLRTLSGKLTQWSSKNASASEVGRRVNFSGRIRLWSSDFNGRQLRR